MKSVLSKVLVAAGLLSLSLNSAYAVTKAKAKTKTVAKADAHATYHCVNDLKQEIKAASKASQCKLPYKWQPIAQANTPKAAKATKTAAKASKGKKVSTKAKRPHVAIVKHKKKKTEVQ